MLIRIFTLFSVVFLVSCVTTTGLIGDDKLHIHIIPPKAKKIFETQCSKGELYQNNIAFIIRLKFEGKVIAYDDKNFSPISVINRLGEELKHKGYEISSTAQMLQIPQNGKLISFTQWRGDEQEARKRLVEAAKHSLDDGGIDYLSFGEVNITEKGYDGQIDTYLAEADTNISLLNVHTGEVLGVTNKVIMGQGRDPKRAAKSAMIRSIKAGIYTVMEKVKPPPKSCLSKGHQILLWFHGYSNERKEVTPFRNELLKHGVIFIRCRKQEDENYDGIYNGVCTVRYKQKGFGLNNLINTIIDKYKLDKAIEDVQVEGYKLDIFYNKPKD